jgi:hypothetical protein
MQFQVPQFLDVEDKLIGPLTIKQFIYLVGGVGGGYVVFRLIPWTIIAIIPALLVVAIGLALAFYKFNNKPFVYLLESGFVYLTSSRLYIWKKRDKKEEERLDLKLTEVSGKRGLPSAGGSKLHSLNWQMDASQTVAGSDQAEPDDRI